MQTVPKENTLYVSEELFMREEGKGRSEELMPTGDSLRAALGTPSAPQSSARPSINRGTVSGATPHPEGEHQQTPPLFIEGVPNGRGSSKRSAEVIVIVKNIFRQDSYSLSTYRRIRE